MALQSQTEIHIGGTKIKSFKRFVLNQDINAHHFLKLECRTDVLESLDGEISDSTKNYLGETLKLEVASLSNYSGYKQLLFQGVVTSITSRKGHNNNHIVSIIAESPTVLTDDGPNYNSYIDKTLTEILQSAFQGYDTSKLKTLIDPNNSASLHYCVQQKESSWNFVSRLAMQYGEWLYYDGEKVVFGKPEEEDEETLLTYGHDLQEFSLDLIPLPNSFNYFTNDYLVDDNHEKKTKDINTSTDGHSDFVSDKSQSLYGKETNVWVNGFNDPTLKNRIDSYVEQQKKAVETKQVRLKGISDNPGVTIGKVINIKSDKVNHGQYRVIKVRHTNNENGQYQNIFEAVSTKVDVFPDTDIQIFPKSESQTAVVMENIDPDNLARVKVQLPWQKLTGEMTPWIRVVTPHGGADKGFHFIPEIGEEVLIGFEGSNAERPYMMGSLYNGSKKSESWKTDNNDIKAIRTRSGHTIELNDTDGEEYILINDKNGNVLNFNTKDKTITISSEEKMILSSKYIALVGDDIEFHSKNTKSVSSEAFIAQTGDSRIAVMPKEVTNISQSVSIEAKKEAKISATKVITNSKADTLISGAIVKLNS